MSEFELINQFFAGIAQTNRKDVLTGIGDDCAILEVPSDQELLVSMDTLVSGVHFPPTTSPFDIGHKALAVNLSDLAAMGALPAWATLALTLPQIDLAWLESFSKGFFSLANLWQVALVGGDTTQGPLSITIQAHGFAPRGQAIKRSGAKVGDLIYVTNALGDAGLALKQIKKACHLQSPVYEHVMGKLNKPFPRIKEGLLLRDKATSMIDISDGLIADLGHILRQSNKGACLDLEKIPISSYLKQSLEPTEALKLALSAGDDYELCFTIPAEKKDLVENIMLQEQCSIHYIGKITAHRQLLLQLGNQFLDAKNFSGYVHFNKHHTTFKI